MERRKLLSYLGLGGVLPLSTVIASEDRNKPKKRIRHYNNISDLKSAELSIGDLVMTLGYHLADDGGGTTYRIESKAVVDSSRIDAVTYIALSNNQIAVLLKPAAVNYQMFGAKGDGISNDGLAISAAHSFANLNNLPVDNLSGEYWIKDTRGIEIETSVRWGNTVFHIDEKFNTPISVFRVKSKEEGQEIFTDETGRSALLEAVKPGAQIIPALAPFANKLLHFKDDIDRIGFRAGERYNSPGRSKEELLYIELEGKVLGDIAWTFKPSVVITAYSTEMSYLTIDGGTFLLSGEDPIAKDTLYSQCGILVSRSRTKIMNQWVGLEASGDLTMRPRSGFYYFQLAYDVELENIRLVPREKNREGEDRDVPEGTYGIGGNRVLNLRLKNITAEGTDIHWGVMGTNMMKNIYVDRCQINRFDVHFHLWNLTIRDSNIGNKGITITGGGKLVIENTRCQRNDFLNFRRDYGAKWDGEIIMRNCILQPYSTGRVTLMNFTADDFHYGYPIGLAHSIQVEDILFDFSNVTENTAPCWLFRTSDFSKTTEGERLFFPEYIYLKNVRVKGRDRGVRIMKLVDVENYYLQKGGSYDGSLLKGNSSIILEQVDLEYITTISGDREDSHFITAPSGQQDHKIYDEHAPHIKLIVRRCEAFSSRISGLRAELLFEDSKINQLLIHDEKGLEGRVRFSNCDLVPVVLSDQQKPFSIDAQLSTSLINCTIHLPQINGKHDATLLPLLDFLPINGEIKYNHINSRLSRGWHAYNKSQGIILAQAFRNKLMISTEEI